MGIERFLVSVAGYALPPDMDPLPLPPTILVAHNAAFAAALAPLAWAARATTLAQGDVSQTHGLLPPGLQAQLRNLQREAQRHK